jgi:hypothetical protein
MGAHVFVGLAIEWANLYNRNEICLDLKVSIPGVDLGACRHLVSRGTRRVFSTVGVDVDGTEEAGSTSKCAR